METYTYRIIIEPDGKQFHAYVPALSGCHSFGKTISEAKKNINEAIRGFVESLIKEGAKVPKDEGMEMFQSIKIDLSKKVHA